MTTREAIIETVNRLFIHTDNEEWDELKSKVFTPHVDFDMSAMGGKKMDTTSEVICDTWAEGFKGLDAMNHLAGNFLVSEEDEHTATVFCYATATHYKESATKGKTRTYVGTYNLGLTKTSGGWRINRFAYKLKYEAGNVKLA